MKIPAKFRKYITFSNGLFVLLLIYVLLTQGKNIINNFQSEGKNIDLHQAYSFTESKLITYPPMKSRSMAIFWSSTCAPCMLEMKRLNKSISDGHIDRGKIFAINMGESPETIKRFINKTKYPLHFITAPEIIRKLNITATPTSILLEKNNIISISTGMSLIGIWRAEYFLKD